MRPFWIATRFLTRLPIPDPGVIAPPDFGRAVPWYPAVGLLLGIPLALAGLALMAVGTPSGLAAALLLTLWVWSTGALHLDGLADSADAWVGGLGDRARTLEIMKDPRTGPMGATALILVLLLKWTALDILLSQGQAGLLLEVPLLARAQLPLLLLTMSYARTRGMATDAVEWLPRRAAWSAVLAAQLGGLLLAGWIGLLWLPLMLLVFWLARRAMRARLGGFTGDTAGALVEVTEVVLLSAAVLALSWTLRLAA